MELTKLFIEDLTYEQLEFCDKYIKQTISNARAEYYREKYKDGRQEYIILDYDTFEEVITDFVSNNIPVYINACGVSIPVYNHDLAEAILELRDKEREIILRNIVLGDTLKDIANDLGVTFQMVSKYKIKAIKNLRKRMLDVFVK